MGFEEEPFTMLASHGYTQQKISFAFFHLIKYAPIYFRVPKNINLSAVFEWFQTNKADFDYPLLSQKGFAYW